MRNLLILLAMAPALSGCVASLATSAVGAAVQAARGEPRVVTQDLRSSAAEACRARGASSGTVQIIDAEQRTDGRVTIWGTVQAAQQRRSFECIYQGRIIAFRLRDIQTR